MIRLRVALLVAGMGFLATAPAWAAPITLQFSGTSTGGDGPLDGTAVLTGTAGGSTLALTLTNDIANEVSIGQSISGFSFEVEDAAGHLVTITPTITAQSGREVSFSGGNDTATDFGSNGSGVDTTGWGLSSSNPTYVNGLGFTGNGTNPPDELILGAPSSGLTWDDADGSIDNSHSHQPQVDQTLNLTLSLGTTLPTGFSIVNAIMYFGTGPETALSPSVTTTATTPEPASLALLGTGLGLLGIKLRKRKATA